MRKAGQKKRGGGAAIAALEAKCLSRDIIPITGRGEKYKSEAALARRLAAPGARTYRIYTQLNAEIFEAMLDARGWKKQPSFKIPVTLMHADATMSDGYPRGLKTSQFAIIKNKLDGGRIFTDKDTLWTHSDAAMRGHLMRTITDSKDIESIRLPAIMKPAMRGKGSGIKMAATYDELRAAWNGPYARPTASEYLMDPYLLGGRKSHFRVYLLVAVFVAPPSPGAAPAMIKKAWLCHEGIVVTAAAPYVKADWGNRLIHDSHMGTTNALHFISKIPEYAALMPLMIDVARRTSVYARHFKLYPEQRHGYNIYGADMLYDTAQRRMYLMEVNLRAGMSYKYGGKPEISRILFGGVMAVIDAFFAGRYAALGNVPGFTRVW